MTWVPYLALQYSWSAGTAYTRYYFILLAGTAIPLQGVWNCFNYARTRQLRHARELFSSLVSSVSRRQSIRAGNTELVTAATSSVVPFMATRSLLDNHDDELLTFFSSTSTPSDVVYDPNYWISSNESLPVPPSHFPILNSSVSIPGGNALLIGERIKKVLRDRSIVASYDSLGAKADCFTKEKVRFRIRLYRRPGVIDTIIVEVQRVDGFDLVFQTDTLAILSAAEGRDMNPGLSETFVYYPDDGIDDTDEIYTPESLGLVNDLLFPADGEAKIERTEMALSALTAFVNVNRVGNLAALMSRDLFYSEQFVRLREIHLRQCILVYQRGCLNLKSKQTYPAPIIGNIGECIFLLADSFAILVIGTIFCTSTAPSCGECRIRSSISRPGLLDSEEYNK